MPLRLRVTYRRKNKAKNLEMKSRESYGQLTVEPLPEMCSIWVLRSSLTAYALDHKLFL